MVPQLTTISCFHYLAVLTFWASGWNMSQNLAVPLHVPGIPDAVQTTSATSIGRADCSSNLLAARVGKRFLPVIWQSFHWPILNVCAHKVIQVVQYAYTSNKWSTNRLISASMAFANDGASTQRRRSCWYLSDWGTYMQISPFRLPAGTSRLTALSDSAGLDIRLRRLPEVAPFSRLLSWTSWTANYWITSIC